MGFMKPVSTLENSFTLGDRDRKDGCPGALTMHHAVDGAIGRVRVAGGQLTPAGWKALAAMARELGDGDIHLTTRGNLQIRGVTDEDAFTREVVSSGFLPSRAHDKVRNIIASPMDGEIADLVRDLDRALLASDKVTGLSGRTLFGLDDGSGLIFAHEVDFGAIRVNDVFYLILGGTLTGVQMNHDQVAASIVAIAEKWQEIRGKSWRVKERPEKRNDLIRVLDGEVTFTAPPNIPPNHDRPIGWIDRDNSVTLVGAVRFGVIPAELADLIAATGKKSTVTPWHRIVIHGFTEAEAEEAVKKLAPAGLIFDKDSPWLRVTACTGLPECQKGKSNTRRDAQELVASGKVPSGLVHFVGCERRCGHPLQDHTEYLATGDGEYEVTEAKLSW
ncbi:hypothetical protein HMPREF1219_00551 [Corynebacterium pyruviciproducens ATCC BAA-1742]|uniref:Nitrite/Sulfite reductase ferredoxin-like domain-containing protein n=1 Tax=Corynebacterium pyruviciproducens ATCC BAA-1742 TaxID=1125779 RepID=S2Z0F3_9CORY|nr:hypothetical protein HMPREF1219_00551 [Corynebacterium pyruviciproducens ATCC BAA-1742]